MMVIDPSHFVTLSFLIFAGIVVRKRFFNLGEFLDGEIQTIKNRIESAAMAREKAVSCLKETSAKLENVDAEVAAIIEKGNQSCEKLMVNMRHEITVKIQEKQTQYSMRCQQLEKGFQKFYQAELIRTIFALLKDQVNTERSDTFHQAQVEQSLALLTSVEAGN